MDAKLVCQTVGVALKAVFGYRHPASKLRNGFGNSECELFGCPEIWNWKPSSISLALNTSTMLGDETTVG
jgi:hypothetical protein